MYIVKNKIVVSPMLKGCVAFCVTLSLLVFAFEYLSVQGLLITAIILTALLMALSQLQNKTAILLIFASIAAVLYMALLLRLVYETQQNYGGGTYDVVFELSDNPVSKYGTAKVEGKIKKIDGKSVNFGAVMYLFDGSPSYTLGDVIETTTTIYVSTSNSYLNSKGIFMTMSEGEQSELSGNMSHKLRHLPRKLAIGFDLTIKKYMGETQEAAVMTALVAGDRAGISDTQNRQFSVSGLSHIIAVSGMHITIIAGMVIMIFGKKVGSLVAIFAVLAYAAISGFSPSAFRAAFMTSVMLIGFLLKRNYDSKTGLAMALSVILIQNPFAIYSVGMTLSFAACLGITLFSSRINTITLGITKNMHTWLKKPVEYVGKSVGVTLAAQVFTTPILLSTFSRVSVVGVLTNLFAIFPSTLGIALGYIALMVEPIFPWLAAVMFKYMLMPIISFLLLVSRVGASYEFASVASNNIYFTIFYMTSMLCFVYALFRSEKWCVAVGAVVIVGAICMYGGVYDYRHNTYVTMTGIGGEMAVLVNYKDTNIGIGAGSWVKNQGGVFYENELFESGADNLDSLYLIGNTNGDAMAAHRAIEEITIDEIIAPVGTPFDRAQTKDTEVVFYENGGAVTTDACKVELIKVADGEYAAMIDFEIYRILVFTGKEQESLLKLVKDMDLKCDVLVVPETFAKDKEVYAQLCIASHAAEVVVESETYDSDIPVDKYFFGITRNTRDEKKIEYRIKK